MGSGWGRTARARVGIRKGGSEDVSGKVVKKRRKERKRREGWIER